MAEPWPAGVRQELLREGYSREPEDVVARHSPESGPPIRRLADAVRKQTIKGVLRLPAAQFTDFEAWYEDDLAHGAKAFDWTITDTGEAHECKFASPVEARRPGGTDRLIQLEIIAQPQSAPSLSLLGALAALSGPEVWPSALMPALARDGFKLVYDDVVLSADYARGPDDRRRRTAFVGETVDAVFRFSAAETAAFESWFAQDLGFGALDFSFPWAGADWLACFNGSYTVAPGPGTDWLVSVPLYLEAPL